LQSRLDGTPQRARLAAKKFSPLDFKLPSDSAHNVRELEAPLFLRHNAR
jgi:hypothetical protein